MADERPEVATKTPGAPAPTAPTDAVSPGLRGTFATWAAITLDLVRELEQSGLVVNGAPRDSVSHALAAATIELTHAGLVYAWVMGNSVSLGDPMAEASFPFRDAVPVRTCRVCGCTEDRACEGGCSWLAFDLCSACEDFEEHRYVAEDERDVR